MSNQKRPERLRIVVFIDGQNFFNDCRRNFNHGYTHPHLIGQELCSKKFGDDRELVQVRFYTGIHSASREPKKHASMARRLEVMKTNNVWTFSRPLKYGLRNISESLKRQLANELHDNCHDCDEINSLIEKIETLLHDNIREKGVDVRIALDLVTLAILNYYDVAILVSTDTDLDESVEEVINLRESLNRWLTVENAVCVQDIDPKTGKRPPFKRLAATKRLLHIDHELFLKIRDDTNYSP